MLAIRLQRTGRAKHAQYRMVVQDSRKSPTSGKIVTSLGSYNPHTKAVTIDKEKAGLFLSNGAQPSPRVVSLLAKEGVTIPDWAQKLVKKERSIKNVDKLRKNRPAVAEVVTDEPAVEVAPEAEAVAETSVEEASTAEEPIAEVETPEASDEVAQSSTESEVSNTAEVVAEAEAPSEEPTLEA
jgi:small subunit ribosomal protein S16